MGRYVYILLFAVVLFAPFVVRRVVATAGSRADESVPAGAPELVVVTPHNQDIRRTFARAFSDWHRERHGTPVRVTYLTPGGANDIVRLLRDKYDAARDKDRRLPPEESFSADIDMMWGGGDYPFEVELKPQGILKPATIDPALFRAAFPSPDIAGVPLYEVPAKPATATAGAAATQPVAGPRWVGVALSGFGLIYNPTLYRTLGLPPAARWEDLADPRLNGYVAGTDPMRSASIASAYNTIVQRAMADAEERVLAERPDLRAAAKAERQKDAGYQAAIAGGWKRGMGTLLLMAANARYFTDSGSQPCNDVGNGEAAAGVAIDFYARVTQEALGADRIAYVPPVRASAVNADPIAILYGVKGERLRTANRFIEFLLTPEAQRLWAVKGGESPYVPRSLRRLPVRRDAYADRAGWADDVNPFEEAGGFNLRPEWQVLFGDMRAVWTAAWIDARSELKDAYDAILAVPDAARRDALLAELATLPVEMRELLDQRSRRRSIEDGKDPAEKDARLWMTRRRVAWASKFRDHYRGVAARAK